MEDKKIIKLPCYEIVVELEDKEDGTYGGGNITSDLHEEPQCYKDGQIDRKEIEAISFYNTAMDAIEALILGHACAGVDITTYAYLEGIESAVQGCSNNL